MGILGSLMNAITGTGSEPIPDGAIFIDVRSPGEVASGGIDGAINIPLADLERKCSKALPDKSKSIVVFCASGMRSSSARKTLIALGYESVINGGGISSLVLKTGKRIV
jgi:phage shock protein E